MWISRKNLRLLDLQNCRYCPVNSTSLYQTSVKMDIRFPKSKMLNKHLKRRLCPITKNHLNITRSQLTHSIHTVHCSCTVNSQMGMI